MPVVKRWVGLIEERIGKEEEGYHIDRALRSSVEERLWVPVNSTDLGLDKILYSS